MFTSVTKMFFPIHRGLFCICAAAGSPTHQSTALNCRPTRLVWWGLGRTWWWAAPMRVCRVLRKRYKKHHGGRLCFTMRWMDCGWGESGTCDTRVSPCLHPLRAGRGSSRPPPHRNTEQCSVNTFPPLCPPSFHLIHPHVQKCNIWNLNFIRTVYI